MCLVAFALDAHPRHPLVLAGNRDEAHDRPAAPLGVWDDAATVVAGRDLQAGGTWLGVTPDHRWAVLTNVRAPRHPRPSTRSRGALVADYLRGGAEPRDYAHAIHAARDDFDGFNLVVGRGARAYAVSTQHEDVKRLGPGVYGLSNAQLDTGWPKVSKARTALREALERDPVRFDDLFALLDDLSRPWDWMLPDTGVGLELERVLSPIRIVTEGYGTRVSTALAMTAGGPVRIAERTWLADGTAGDMVQLEL